MVTLKYTAIFPICIYMSWLRVFSAQVSDFGLSREEMVNRHASNIKGTLGYLDPEYVSSRSFTKKSDVYSYGILLFELIAGRNPQQGLMEYVDLVSSLLLSKKYSQSCYAVIFPHTRNYWNHLKSPWRQEFIAMIYCQDIPHEF